MQVILYDQCLFLWFTEVLPEIENQGEYEGQNFNFTSPDNLDNGGSQNLTKLTTANLEDMEEYYNFGKDASSYGTPWVLQEQRTRICLCPNVIKTLKERRILLKGGLISTEAFFGRTDEAWKEMYFTWDIPAALKDSPTCMLYVSAIKKGAAVAEISVTFHVV